MICRLLPLALASTVIAAAQPEPPPFRDPARPIEQRVADLLTRLTVDEKISLLMMDSPAVPRLGIPAYHWWNEGLHGYARSGIATVFPQAIGLAATWNPALLQQVGDVVSTEARAKHEEATALQNGRSRIYQGLTIWSPNINIFRDPRWGRGQETYGEDPFLTGTLGAAFVRGIQGPDPRHPKAVATLKHFAVHSGPEKLRHTFDARPSPTDLHETYLPAFEQGVREGGALSVMSAYNAVDGIPAPANTHLLQTLLRDTWGFAGAVVGDVDCVADLWSTHKFAPDAAAASALALRTGNDLCSGRSYEALPSALARGLVAETDLDRSLARLLGLRLRLGTFDPPAPAAPPHPCDTPEHSALALAAARQSIVLLKNDGVLPWNPAAIKTLAILGPTADSATALLGNYEGTPSRPVLILDGLRARLEPLGVRILHEPATPLVDGLDMNRSLPKECLFTDATLKTVGLKLEVFDNPDLVGAPLHTKTDTGLARTWNDYNLAPDVPERSASLRWTGLLVPQEDGEVQFSIRANSGFRFQLGELIDRDEWSGDPEQQSAGPALKAVLKRGVAYPIRFEYTQRELKDGSAQLSLWKSPIGNDTAYANALAAARAADHILLVLGLTPQLEGEEMSIKLPGFEGGDRSSIQLPATQSRLLAEVSALGKPVVVVLTTGSALSLDTGKTNALLCAWYYGQNGGQALAEILLGDTNPSGRLPVTFYAADSDLPDFNDYAMAGRTYRYFGGKPLFAFGHGLSYTTFAYTDARLSADSMPADGEVRIRVSVKNTGTRQGDEVVQVYARELSPRTGKPLRQLVAFQRVSVAPGATVQVELPLQAARLHHWDTRAGCYAVEPCAYALDLGPASDRTLATLTLEIR